MAVRVVKQCSCLLREATRLVPSVAPVGQLRLAWVTPKTWTSSATSPSSQSPGALTELVGKEQVFAPSPEHQEVDYLIEKATRPEELLKLFGGNQNLHHNQAALVLIRLSRLLSDKPKEKALLIQDPRFHELIYLINSQIASVWHGTLMKLLRSLYSLELPQTSKELQSVEQEVRWRLRRLKYKHLVFLAEFCASSMQKQHSQELMSELLVHLERRWTEIEDSRTVVTVMVKAGHLSESLMNHLEDKGLHWMGPLPPARPRHLRPSS